MSECVEGGAWSDRRKLVQSESSSWLGLHASFWGQPCDHVVRASQLEFAGCSGEREGGGEESRGMVVSRRQRRSVKGCNSMIG